MLSKCLLSVIVLVVCSFASQSAEAQSSQPPFPAQSQRPDQTKPLEDKSIQAAPQHEPTAAEMSKKETVASAFLRGLQYQEYEVRSAAEAMPEEKYGYRPAEGRFKDEKPQFGPAEVRTFAEQVKHVACANFAFAAELDGQKPPAACDKGGPSPAKTKKELLSYLRDSFAAIRKSLGAIDAKNMFDPIEGPYAGPNTRLGLATVIVWHNADHYGQMVLYLRENNIVPSASRPNPPELNEESAMPGPSEAAVNSERPLADHHGVGLDRCLYCPQPEYSDEARKAKYQGTVLLDVTVTADGRVITPVVIKGPGLGLVEKALAQVKNWKMLPALGPDGRPVSSRVRIEVSFREY